MQNKLSKGILLDDNGSLLEAGYSTYLIKDYDRKMIKAHKSRIKEWDYYYFGNKNFGVALTIADNSYMSMVSVSFLDFLNKEQITKSSIKLFSNGKLNMPSTSEVGDIIYSDKKVEISFVHEKDVRHIRCSYLNFKNKDTLKIDAYLTRTNKDSLVIATPFKKKRHFYYNQKINLLAANGYVKLGDKFYELIPDSFGVLDWGRGVWTYSNTWYWASGNGISEGRKIGFNLGYGFGDTSNSSENILYVDDVSYKLDDVRFNIPLTRKNKYDYLSPWSMNSKNGDINLIFTPVINRSANMNLLILSSKQNQVFGIYKGFIKIEDKYIYIDNVFGFAEKVINKW